MLGIGPSDTACHGEGRGFEPHQPLARNALQCLPEGSLITRGHKLFGLGRNERIAERFHLGWWNRADELSDFTSVLEGFDRWNPLDLEGSGDPLVLVGVDLDELNLAFPGLGGALERRRQLPAWSAPRGPEVDDDGELPRLRARRRTGPLVNARSSPRNALSIAGPSSPTSGSASGSA
jgi:hypothetical protein